MASKLNKSGTIYINLITVSSKVSEETEKVLNSVLQAINTSKGTRLELIKNLEEKTLEVRQIG